MSSRNFSSSPRRSSPRNSRCCLAQLCCLLPQQTTTVYRGICSCSLCAPLLFPSIISRTSLEIKGNAPRTHSSEGHADSHMPNARVSGLRKAGPRHGDRTLRGSPRGCGHSPTFCRTPSQDREMGKSKYPANQREL